MSIANAWNLLYKQVNAQDYDTQTGYLRIISEKVRSIPLEYLTQEEALFIPNDDYVKTFLGNSALLNENGFYYDGNSIWSGYVIFPIRDLGNHAKGLGGFNPQIYLQAKETQDYSMHYYSYTSKSLFSKGDFLFWGKNGFDKAYEDGYVILVDGMFDAVQLRGLGFNAAALMGSSLTESILAQLRFIKRKIIISDNDEAGYKLEMKLKRNLKDCVSLRQSYDKDVDGAIKLGYSDKIIRELNKMINDPVAIEHVLR